MYSRNNNAVGRRVPRRPFLHMVVLFGNDPRVMNYAQGIMQQFLNAGIDTWLHSAVYANNNSRQLVDIKPEHLVSVITSSHADHLIVIGDRNMKNNTCQGRHQGKLIELSIEEQIRFVLVDWSKATSMGGLKLSKSRSTSSSSATTFNRETSNSIASTSSNTNSTLNNGEEVEYGDTDGKYPNNEEDGQLPLEQQEQGQKEEEEEEDQPEEEIIIMSDEEVLNSLRQYGRTGNVNDRLDRLENMLNDLESFSNRSGGRALRPDRSTMGKLTKAQTSLIKLHTDVDHLITKVRRAPRMDIMAEQFDLSNPSASYEHIVKYMGLGRGMQVDGMYRPSAPGSMSKEVEDMLLPPLAEDFRDRALDCLEKISVEVEDLGSRLSAIAVGGGGSNNSRNLINGKVEQRGSLWDHYIQEHRRKKEESKNRMLKMVEQSKNLNSANIGGDNQKEFTLNDLSADLRQLVDEGVLNLDQAIAMLKEQGENGMNSGSNSGSNDGDGADNNESNDADTWKLTGAAGKKKKKQKRRELEEQRRREREANQRRIAEMEARKEMQRRQQQKQHQQKIRAQQMAQQEAMRRAQEQQQMQLQKQMEMMQRQLQQQIQIQKAAAAQIQMQIEEQQRQAMLKSQQKNSQFQQQQQQQQQQQHQQFPPQQQQRQYMNQQQNLNRGQQMQPQQQNRQRFQQQQRRGQNQQQGRNNQRLGLNTTNNPNNNNFQQGKMTATGRGNGNLNMMGNSRNSAGRGGVMLNEGMVNLNFNNNRLPSSTSYGRGINTNNAQQQQQQQQQRRQNVPQMRSNNNDNSGGMNFGVSRNNNNAANNINSSSVTNTNNQSLQFSDSNNANFSSSFNSRSYNNVNNNNNNNITPTTSTSENANNKSSDTTSNSVVNLQQTSSGFHNPYNSQTVGGGVNANTNLPYSANSKSFTPQVVNDNANVDPSTTKATTERPLWAMMQGGNNPTTMFETGDTAAPQMNITAKEFVPSVSAKEFVPSGFSMPNAPMNGVYPPPAPDSPPHASLMKPQSGNMSKGPSSTNQWNSSGNSYAQW